MRLPWEVQAGQSQEKENSNMPLEPYYFEIMNIFAGRFSGWKVVDLIEFNFLVPNPKTDSPTDPAGAGVTIPACEVNRWPGLKREGDWLLVHCLRHHTSKYGLKSLLGVKYGIGFYPEFSCMAWLSMARPLSISSRLMVKGGAIRNMLAFPACTGLRLSPNSSARRAILFTTSG